MLHSVSLCYQSLLRSFSLCYQSLLHSVSLATKCCIRFPCAISHCCIQLPCAISQCCIQLPCAISQCCIQFPRALNLVLRPVFPGCQSHLCAILIHPTTIALLTTPLGYFDDIICFSAPSRDGTGFVGCPRLSDPFSDHDFFPGTINRKVEFRYIQPMDASAGLMSP